MMSAYGERLVQIAGRDASERGFITALAACRGRKRPFVPEAVKKDVLFTKATPIISFIRDRAPALCINASAPHTEHIFLSVLAHQHDGCMLA
jgi:hypothetical protein